MIARNIDIFFSPEQVMEDDMSPSAQPVYFYKHVVNLQVFYKSKFTYALVNLKPLVAGHVLVVPLRATVLRFGDMTAAESYDYMNTLQLIHKFIGKTYKADALNIAIQDGPESGQSIPHLHTHIIPRYGSDEWGDRVHSDLEKYDLENIYTDFHNRKSTFQQTGGMVTPDDALRAPRSVEEMAKEALWLEKELKKYIEQQDS